MRVLFIGHDQGHSGYRLAALRRLGHEVTLLNPDSAVPQHRIFSFWMWHLGSVGLADYVRARLIPQVPDGRYDLAWVDHGHLVSARFTRELKQRVPIVLCYNTDDPFGGRDSRHWMQYLGALPFYDLVIVVRRVNLKEAYAAGAKRVMFVYMSADDVVHTPLQLSVEEYERWRSDVLFVGTAFPERGPFLAELVNQGIPLTIYGNQWEKLKEWPLLKRYLKGGGLNPSTEYGKAISAAKICIGLLSKGNRDMHTTRSMEVPALGSVLCAERTIEHLALYKDGEQALFWDDAKECARVCKEVLRDNRRRQSIAANGHQRYLKNRSCNIRMVDDILRAALDPSNEILEEYHARLPVPVVNDRASAYHRAAAL